MQKKENIKMNLRGFNENAYGSLEALFLFLLFGGGIISAGGGLFCTALSGFFCCGRWRRVEALAAHEAHLGRQEVVGELLPMRHEKRGIGAAGHQHDVVVAELRRANEILKAAAIFFGAELDRPGRR